MVLYKNARNPVLPAKIHIPDSEAHVMPDGKLYLYGSLDECENMYCSDRYHVVSTGDLENWTIHEGVFHGRQVPWYNDPLAAKYETGHGEPTAFEMRMQEMKEPDDMDFVLSADIGHLPPLLFAPDCIEKDGMYYLYFCMADGSEGVASARSPEGPFEDPVRLPCSGIDPAVFVDEDGQGYYYWGQFRSHGVRLNGNMTSFDTAKIKDHLLTEEEHCFHEGTSIRKIGDLYYAVYSDVERGRPTALGYATSRSPLGPFEYCGILIDNADCDPSCWNNHGSIEYFRGQWYVFYHRSSRNTKINRRLCIEPITIMEDGTIPEVPMTSQGAGKPFGPGETIMAYRACGLSGNLYIDVDPETGMDDSEVLTGILASDRALFRYIYSENGFKKIDLSCRGSGIIGIKAGSNNAGRIVISSGCQMNRDIVIPPGEHELELVFIQADDLAVRSVTLG